MQEERILQKKRNEVWFIFIFLNKDTLPQLHIDTYNIFEERILKSKAGSKHTLQL